MYAYMPFICLLHLRWRGRASGCLWGGGVLGACVLVADDPPSGLDPTPWPWMGEPHTNCEEGRLKERDLPPRFPAIFPSPLPGC